MKTSNAKYTGGGNFLESISTHAKTIPISRVIRINDYN
jgi:hypothetical protein